MAKIQEQSQKSVQKILEMITNLQSIKKKAMAYAMNKVDYPVLNPEEVAEIYYQGYVDALKCIWYPPVTEPRFIRPEEFNIEYYQDFLDKMASSANSDVLSNKGVAHASLLSATLLRNTNNSLLMYTDFRPDLLCGKRERSGQGFEGIYWYEFKKFFKERLKSGCFRPESVKIILKNDDYIDNEPIRIISEALNCAETCDKIVIYKATPAARAQVEEILGRQEDKEESHYDFSVYDTNMFRLEFEADTYKSLASFNCTLWSSILTDFINYAPERFKLENITEFIRNKH